MGLIRGGLIFLVGLVLFFSFLAMNAVLTVGSSLKYENIQPELRNVINNIGQKEIKLESNLDSSYNGMNSSCNSDSYIQLNDSGINGFLPCSVVYEGPENITNFILIKNSDLDKNYIYEKVNQSYDSFVGICTSENFTYESKEFGYSLEIPCSVIVQGKQEVLNYSIDSLTERIYYQEYDCDYWNCFGKTGMPLFLLSEKSSDYWMAKFYFLLVFSLILCAILFFLSEKKTDSFIIVSAILLVSALPLLKIYELLNWIFGNRFLDSWQYFSILFNQSHNIFRIILITSIVLVVVSIGLKLVFFSNRVSKYFSSDDKESEKKDTKDKKKSDE